MVFEKKPKIGIVVGLKSEKRTLSSKYNLFVESGYGKKAYNAAKRVINQNVDLIVSFGLAGSMTAKLKNSEIIIPKVILSKGLKSKKTSTFSNNYFKKKSKENIISDVKLFTSEKILNNNSRSLKVDAVDMEAGYVLKAAQEHKVPFTSVKVIFDDLDNPIPNFLVTSINEDGELKIWDLMFEILKNPLRIKNLLKMNKIYKRSMHKLKIAASQLF